MTPENNLPDQAENKDLNKVPVPDSLAQAENIREQEAVQIAADFERLGQDKPQEVVSSGDLGQGIAGAKTEIASKLGKKGVLIILLVVFLLLCAALYVMQNQKGDDSLKISINADTNTEAPPATVDQTAAVSDLPKFDNAHDAERAQNLTTIANIAAVYNLEQAADLPISKEYVHLNEANPVTDFLREALKKYGKGEDLLLDPLNPDFYYTYRSLDGKNIEFSARLEDMSNPYCTGQDLCLYKKALTESDIIGMSSDLEKYK